MQKDLYMKSHNEKILVQSDDLKYDGKNIIIPSYYVNPILDYVKDYKLDGVPQVDIEDYQLFRNFLYDVQEYKNKGN